LKAAIISPTPLLRRYSSQSTYHLALAHLVLTDIDYCDFYREAVEEGDYVIMDNSVIELGYPMPVEELIKAIARTGAQELILPDYPQDPKKTFLAAHNAAPIVRHSFPDVKLQAVPQWYGSMDPDNWMNSHTRLVSELDEEHKVDVIGIPKFLGKYRPAICESLNLQHSDHHEYHLLGTTGNPLEIKDLTKHTWLRGVDTKAPVRFGTNGIVLHPELGLLADVRDCLPAMNMSLGNDPFPIISNHNVSVFKAWAEGNKEAQILEFNR